MASNNRALRVCQFQVLLWYVLACTAPAVFGQSVDFSRQVRPILASYCFKCHGPDASQRQAGLRLDDRKAATSPADSGRIAIVAGKPEESELIRRIFSQDDAERMPPPEEKRPLSDDQKELLRRWIAEGAPYTPHWSFQPIRLPALPKIRNTEWPLNGIDYFVLARLEMAGWVPNPPADRYTLIRRLYLDLLGVVPSPEEADAFAADTAPDAYERLVDRLLASPRYGERWARRWLDLARYADTNGYEKDRPRSIWPYRDWVIRALNSDMAFDQFTIEQLAGDMLPAATLAQRVATGFHRNTMLNEEGGIDPLEFRFYAMVDRVNTTATTWLGLTMGCAQCHSHKYDPIDQSDYYRLMALLNNADEPTIEIPVPELIAERDAIEAEARRREQRLAEMFPPQEEFQWLEGRLVSAQSAGGATAEKQPDESVLWTGTAPESDTYTLVYEVPAGRISLIELVAMADERLPSRGPGRTPHGNFVLTELHAQYQASGDDRPTAIRWQDATADAAQDGFPVSHAIDGNPRTGWAVHVAGQWNVSRRALFRLDHPVQLDSPARWTIRLDQQFGGGHTLGRVRVRFGEQREDARPLAIRRQENLERRFREWTQSARARAVNWTVVAPQRLESNLPKLSLLDDSSILASGDQTKRDVYRLYFDGDFAGVTALRLEVLPDERLPRHGPGRVYYEGPLGDFFLSSLVARQQQTVRRWQGATQTFANGSNTAAMAIDEDPQSGWSIDGGQGQAHIAVFRFAEPLGPGPLQLEMVFERYYAAGLGRFRWSVTRTTQAAEARFPAAIEEILTRDEQTWTPQQRQSLLLYFLQTCPELATVREEIAQLRRKKPPLPTTLVMQERPADNPRPTYIHKRGEFLQPTVAVTPGVPGALPPLAEDQPANRLSFARWLVRPDNPLTARVVVNRQWAILFGRGLVRTTEDFGLQGDLPSHPELLDWLAYQWMYRGWSLKDLHRMIVTSATYRQAAAWRPELAKRDPENVLLWRGPSFRLEAEMVRDVLLESTGLLSTKMYGPSVFPPQPPGITSEGTYGPLEWKVSPGEDRYRRGLYTFAKRTAPYAMFATFDGPSGEECVARRETTNTPLQALTLLNDEVVTEAAQQLARRTLAAGDTDLERAERLFRWCLTRPPQAAELAALVAFQQRQYARLKSGELDAATIAGTVAPGADAQQQAAWMLTARAILNLHEMVVKP